MLSTAVDSVTLAAFIGLSALLIRRMRRAKALEVEMEVRKCGACSSTQSDHESMACVHGRYTRSCDLEEHVIRRYSRHLLLPGFGVAGQRDLLESAVLVIGAGGIGSSVLINLVAAGVGKIGVIDDDVVEVSNLPRQFLHSVAQTGKLKVDSARDFLKRLNADVEVKTYSRKLTAQNVVEIIQRYSLVIEASDCIATKYTVNDACFLHKKSLIVGAAQGMEGQVFVFPFDLSSEETSMKQGRHACYRCHFPIPPPQENRRSCAEAGVLTPIPAFIGNLISLEAIKLLKNSCGRVPTKSAMYMFDGVQAKLMSMMTRPNPTCMLCGSLDDSHSSSKIVSLKDTEKFLRLHFALHPCRSISSACHDPARYKDLACLTYLSEFLEHGRQHLLLDVRSEREFQIVSIQGAILYSFARFKQAKDRVGELVTVINDAQIEDVIICCRRGNNSRIVAQELSCDSRTDRFNIYNLKDGLEAWKEEIDPTFPLY